MHQTWPTQGTKHPASDMHTVGVHHVCHDIGRHVSYGSFGANIESQRALSVRYLTTLTQQMLTAIKHVADDKFCFQQDSILAHHACNTVKLQGCELPTSLLLTTAFNLTARQRSLVIMRFRESHISRSIRCDSIRLKKSSSDWLKATARRASQ